MSAWDDQSGVVRLPSGVVVRGRSLRSDPLSLGRAPELSIVLAQRRPQSQRWPSLWVEWPDFRPPKDPEHAWTVLRFALQVAATSRVEIGCGHGVGRTGTALAALVLLDSILKSDKALSMDEAIAWVRRTYHPRAVETRSQRRFLSRPPSGLVQKPRQTGTQLQKRKIGGQS